MSGWTSRACVAAGPFERVHVRPWATALLVPTGTGRLWFKAHTSLLAREAPVTRVLAALRPGTVLDVLASDDERCWLLTRDAGEKIRSRIATTDDLWRLEPVLAAYGDLQRAAAGRTDALLAAGALDRRSDRLGPLLTEALLADEGSGGAGQLEPLTGAERDRLLARVPLLEELGARARSVVSDSIDHSDLHDGNVFVLADEVRIGDFGDSCVGSPFVSLVVLQRVLTDRLGVAPDGPELTRLYRAALEPWTGPASMRELAEVATRVRPLGLLGRGLTWRTLITGIDDPGMHEFADGWSAYARELLAALDTVAG